MDSWTYSDIVSMLEGGNKQLGDFFQRHKLSSSSSVAANELKYINTTSRYKTNAAKFYKNHLLLHVSQVSEAGIIYEGRDTYRKLQHYQKSAMQSKRGAALTNHYCPVKIDVKI